MLDKKYRLIFFLIDYSESVFNSRKTMGDYTNMSNYYDLIMTSGYYDYKKIVNDLISSANSHDVLEIGCGTGLIIEELASRKNDIEITGFDLTQAMLDIARQRLNKFDHVTLEHQNVIGLNLNKQFDLAFSYGGVWYFVMDGVNEPFLVSHIYDEQANVNGLSKVSESNVQTSPVLIKLFSIVLGFHILSSIKFFKPIILYQFLMVTSNLQRSIYVAGISFSFINMLMTDKNLVLP